MEPESGAATDEGVGDSNPVPPVQADIPAGSITPAKEGATGITDMRNTYVIDSLIAFDSTSAISNCEIGRASCRERV